jgi:hypothetical protein
MNTFDACFDAFLIAVTAVGLTQAVLKVRRISRVNKIPRRILLGLWFMYGSTMVYICFLALEDLGFSGFREAGKILFLLFLIVAMPWSTNQVR